MSVMERPQRPRSKSAFSFKSDKSHSSRTSGKHKEHLKETHAEKQRLHISNTTKANPNAAINEAQPIAAALEKSTLGSLRELQHTDMYGNPILEPDLSNPTRPRWERPLETIRSFEAAIDNEYKQRQSMLRAESTPDYGNGYGSRRSSYYGGYDQRSNSRYSHVGGYYGSRRDNFNDNYGVPMSQPSRNRFSQRMQPDPIAGRHGNGHSNSYNPYPQNPYIGNQNPYPTPGYQRSRDTVNTGVSNGSQSEPWANSTEPSSENSSIERHTPITKPDFGEQYNFIGFSGVPQSQMQSSSREENTQTGTNTINNSNPYRQTNATSSLSNNGHHQQIHSGASPPAPPLAPVASGPSSATQRIPIKLGNVPRPLATSSRNAAPNRAQLQPSASVKRKSWFKRKFSKE